MPLVLEWVMWVGCCLGFAYFVASGAWVFAAATLGAILFTVTVLHAHRSLIVLWLLSMPTLFVQTDRFIKGAGVPVVTSDRALMGLLIGFLVLRVVASGSRLPRLSSLEKWMIALLGIVVASYLSTVPERNATYLYQGAVLLVEGYVTPLAAYVLGRSQSWTDRELRRLLALFGVLAIYLTLVGILQYFFGVLIFSPTWLGVGTDTDRAASGFGSPVEFGLVMAMLLALSLLNLLGQRDAFVRMLALVATGAAAVGVGLSLTRAAWLAALVVVAWIFWKDKRSRGLITRGVVIGALAGIMAAAFLMRADVFERRLTELTPIYNRIALWSTAAAMIANHPLTGVGFGFRTFNDHKRENLVSVGPSAMGKYALEPGVPHNEFLHVFAMTGLTGFMAYVMVCRRAWGVTRDTARNPARAGTMRSALVPYVQSLMLVVLVGGMFSELWTFRYLLSLAMFMVGVLASAPGEADGGAGGKPGHPRGVPAA